MSFTRLIATITVATTILGSAFANAEEIALSLVHPKGRIDSPVSAVRRVDALATIEFHNTETGEVHEYPHPHVDVCFAKDIAERMCQLTRQIVGEPMEIVVDYETILKPIVREQLCGPCFQISADDLAAASALAQRIRRGTNRICAPST
jgi:preprotein translocase subunit SecD